MMEMYVVFPEQFPDFISTLHFRSVISVNSRSLCPAIGPCIDTLFPSEARPKPPHQHSCCVNLRVLSPR